MRPEPIEPTSLLEGLQWSAILRGAVLDNLLTLVATIPMMLWLAGAEAFSEDEEVADRAIEAAMVSPEFLLLGFVVGGAITVFAAYWASRRAGIHYLRHGGWTAVTSAMLGFLFMLLPGATSEPSAPLWYDSLGLAMMLPAGLLGGWIAARGQETGP